MLPQDRRHRDLETSKLLHDAEDCARQRGIFFVFVCLRYARSAVYAARRAAPTRTTSHFFEPTDEAFSRKQQFGLSRAGPGQGYG